MVRQKRRGTIDVAVLFRKRLPGITQRRLSALVRYVLREEGIENGEVGIVLVDDDQIHEINRKHLQHDYPTDVITFPFAAPHGVWGEIVCSVDHATSHACRFKKTPQEELLLYVVHGVLHLVGYDDHDTRERQRMSKRQGRLLAEFLAIEKKREAVVKQAAAGKR